MVYQREQVRLRAQGLLCNPRRTAVAGVLAAGVVLLVAAACRQSVRVRTVTLGDLENAPARPLNNTRHVVVREPDALRPLCKPLGPRLSLLQVADDHDWQALAQAAPDIGPRPDLTSGSLVGIVSWAGTPVDADWPVEMETIRQFGGGGLIEASFASGSYLPDGTAFLVSAYVPELKAVLVVDVDGTAFYPGDTR